jgi:serine/threonine protein kinase
MARESTCTQCGASIPAGARFCPQCGASRSGSAVLALGGILDARYRIIARLGEGAMSAVYLAQHERLEREVAIKTIRSLSDPGAVARFMGEARIVAGLTHPNIVQVFDCGVAMGDVPYLVMEHIPGVTLERELEQVHAFPVTRAAHILAQIASGLAEAHAHDLVHRDLKPSNVMLMRRGPDHDFVKILDFGLATKLGIDKGTPQSGTIVGTPFYLAPEAWSGKVDERTDIYAFGVLTYEMVTGRLPFNAQSFTALLTQHLDAVPPMPSEISPGLHAFDSIVLACLAKDPAERPARAGELLDALRLVLQATPNARRRTTYSQGRTTSANATPDPTIYDSRRGLDAYWDGPSLAVEVCMLHAARRRRLRELLNVVFPSGAPEKLKKLGGQVDLLDAAAETLGGQIAALDNVIRDREAWEITRDAELRGALFDASVALKVSQEIFRDDTATLDDGHAADDGPTRPMELRYSIVPDPGAAHEHVETRVARLEREIDSFQRTRRAAELEERKQMELLVSRLDAVEEQVQGPAEALWQQLVQLTRGRSELRPPLLELGKVDGAIASYRALLRAAVPGPRDGEPTEHR